MEQSILQVKDNRQIAQGIYRMILTGSFSGPLQPGTFANIRVEGHFLRRPISLCDVSEKEITLIYRVIGKGTEDMSRIQAGQKLDVLLGLGNGYHPEDAGQNPLLVGGGVGAPPLYLLAKRLIASGLPSGNIRVILGFRRAEEIFLEEEFRALGCRLLLATEDGSYGSRGLVTDAMPEEGYSYIYACGPSAMLKAVWEKSAGDGEFSFEERMGCGFGLCMGCSHKTVGGYKRICKEGPVLRKGEILWD